MIYLNQMIRSQHISMHMICDYTSAWIKRKISEYMDSLLICQVIIAEDSVPPSRKVNNPGLQ